MATINSIFQRIFAFAPRKRAGRTVIDAPTATQDAWRLAMTEAEEQRAFVASIAHLPADEQRKRLRRREAYRHLAERQGVMEAERRAGDVDGSVG